MVGLETLLREKVLGPEEHFLHLWKQSEIPSESGWWGGRAGRSR